MVSLGGEKIVITKCMNEMIKWPSLLISINEWTRTKGNKWKWKSACTMNHNIINNNNEKPKTYQRLQSSSDWIRVIKKKKTQIHRWSDRSLLAFASHQGAVLFIESTNKTQNDKKTTTNKKNTGKRKKNGRHTSHRHRQQQMASVLMTIFAWNIFTQKSQTECSNGV